MAQIIDLRGRRFGRLLALEPSGRRVAGQLMWNVLCDCGTTKEVSGQNLRKGQIVSCGCYVRELASQRMASINRTHGQTNTPIWRVWAGMVNRCTNPANQNWPRYGGRGILVCPRWLTFENFAADMGPRPQGTSIDRIDNDRGYEPGNCRWATTEQQNRNKSDTRQITFGGKTQSASEWARELGMDKGTFFRRLSSGWGVEKAITTPVNKNLSRIRELEGART